MLLLLLSIALQLSIAEYGSYIEPQNASLEDLSGEHITVHLVSHTHGMCYHIAVFK